MFANVNNKSQNNDNDDEDENKLDFNLLLKRTKSLDLNEKAPNFKDAHHQPKTNDQQTSEVWPLYLKTNFIDNYIFGDIVGNGAYAEVRECINTTSLERCAVKIVDKNYLIRQAPHALANQEQEIKLLQKLKHENIISLKETIYKGSKIYIFLEFCTFVLNDLLQITSTNSTFDTTLADNNIPFTAQQESGSSLNTNNNIVAGNSGLPVTLIRFFFKQLLTGLEYLHSQNIVHRDIKPQNLLITTSGSLKIIDFGVSQILSLWLWPSDLCKNHEGSPLFQAPEVVSGQLEYSGFKVDVWSAGVTLYLMVYGQFPFIDEALLGLYDKILAEPLPLPACLSNDCHHDNHQFCQQRINITILNDLISLMLEKEARQRCSINEALKHPWLKLTKENNFNCDNNCYEDHYDEFNELLRQRLTNHSSSLNSMNDGSRTDRKRKFSEKRKEIDCNRDSGNGRKRQRDIYLSMSVLPYLYSHHFPNMPVVKAKRLQRNDTTSLTDTTVSSNSSSTISSIGNENNNNREKSNSHHETKTTTTSSHAFKQATKEDSLLLENNVLQTPDPNEIISDQEIEWGTERQYNLLKLPLIRANRIRAGPYGFIDNKSATKRRARKRVVASSSEGRKKLKERRHSCRRKPNNINDDDDDNINLGYEKKY